MNKFIKSASLLLLSALAVSCADKGISTDLLVIGGGASGTAAGIQAARMDIDAVIVEESQWLGGMLTSAGVSCIDGNRNMPSGFFGEFRDSLANIYGGDDKMYVNWVSAYSFEPSVANALLQRLAARESNHLKLMFDTRLVSIEKADDGWNAVVSDSKGKEMKIHAKVHLDGTEFGDVAKAVGVGYDLGMENGKLTGEDIAPDSAYNIVQDMTMVAILKDYGDSVDMTIPMPEGYNREEFIHTCVSPLAPEPVPGRPAFTEEEMMTYGKLQNGKYMINWPLFGNDYYANIVDMTREERDSVLALAKNHTLQYIYFLQTEFGYKNLGLADDEFPTADKMPYIPYVRESRRIHGLVRFMVNDINTPFDRPQPLYRTGIAVGDYPVDHHHSSYNGPQNLPNLYWHPIPSWCLPMGVLLPKDVDDMIVAEKSISVSNIANGTTRLQPITTQIGQVAGVIAALAVKEGKNVKDVDVREVQNELLKRGGYIMPYLDVKKDDARFVPFQRIGATGILKGEGKSVHWSNETWLHADSVLTAEGIDGFYELYPAVKGSVPEMGTLTLEQAKTLVEKASGNGNVDVAGVLGKYGYEAADLTRPALRGEFAVLVDSVLNPFDAFPVDIEGNFKTK